VGPENSGGLDSGSVRGRMGVPTAILAALAALPSIAWALSRPDLLTDDYMLVALFEREGHWEAVRRLSFEHPARPLLGPYHLLTHGLIADRPVVHAVVLAVLNAAVSVAMWRFGRRWFTPSVAFAAAAFYAVVPNRASTRFWFPTGNHLLAVLLVLVGFHLLVDRRRRVSGSVVLAAGVLLFEGVIGLVVAGFVLWTGAAPRQRWRSAFLALGPSAAAAAWMYWMSPKRRSGTDPDIIASLSTMGHGLFGSGLWGERLGVAGVALVAALTVVAIAGLLPSFATLRTSTGPLRAALVVTVLSAGAFVAAGTSFAVRGIFDRTNAVPLVGVALVFATALCWPHGRGRVLSLGVGVVAIVHLLALNLGDLDDYTEAADEGRTILARVAQDVPPDADAIVWPTSDGPGVAAFIYASDLEAALTLRVGDRPGEKLLPWSRAQCELLAETTPDAVGYDWRRREIVGDPAVLCER